METTMQTELGLRFEEIKRHFKLNDSKLADYAEVTPTSIGNIINGVTDNPKLSLLKNISNKLHISMEWLANGEGEMLKDTTFKPNSFDKKDTDFNLIRYMKKVEYLQTVLLQNGIKVEMPNFNMGVPASDFGQQQHKLIFFYKGVQKRIHPTQY